MEVKGCFLCLVQQAGGVGSLFDKLLGVARDVVATLNGVGADQFQQNADALVAILQSRRGVGQRRPGNPAALLGHGVPNNDVLTVCRNANDACTHGYHLSFLI